VGVTLFHDTFCTVKADATTRTKYQEDSTHKEEVSVLQVDGSEISGLA